MKVQLTLEAASPGGRARKRAYDVHTARRQNHGAFVDFDFPEGMKMASVFGGSRPTLAPHAPSKAKIRPLF